MRFVKGEIWLQKKGAYAIIKNSMEITLKTESEGFCVYRFNEKIYETNEA